MMFKRGLAFLLAAVLAFSPVMQVNATEAGTYADAQVSAEEMTVEAPDEVEIPDEEETPGVIPEETEAPCETPSAESKETETPAETPGESASPEESVSPKESMAPDETPSAEPAESGDPIESESPEESEEPTEVPTQSPEAVAEPSIEPTENPEAVAEPSETPSESPEVTKEAEDAQIDTELVTLITEDITISADTADTSGEGYTWEKATKTFTMNGLQLQGQLTLPDDAVIVLAKGSENSIDNTKKYSKYNIKALGDLTVKGSGKLTITQKNYDAIYVQGNIVFQETNVHFINNATDSCVVFAYMGGSAKFVYSNIKIESVKQSALLKTYISHENCTFTGGEADADFYKPVLNEETGLYEMSFAPSEIYLSKQPEKINKLYVGESVDLSLTAKSAEGETLTYQWYTTEDIDDPDNGAQKVKNATEKKLTVSAKSRGITYYYCKVSSKNSSYNTDVAAVVVSEHKELKICTEKPSFLTTQDKLATEGWKYDSTTHTLTIENMDMLLPFQDNFTNIQIKSGYNVVINGTNYIEDNDGRISITKSGQVGNVTNFSGTGILYSNEIDCFYLDSNSEVCYQGDITLYLKEFDPDYGTSILDGATIKSKKDNNVGGPLVLQNGACFEAADEIDVKGDITVGDACKLISGYDVYCTGSMSIGKDAIAIIDGGLNMASTTGVGFNKDRVLTIYGTLYAKGNYATYPLKLYSQAENPLVLGTGAEVISPVGAVWEETNTQYCYGFKCDDTYIFDELIVGTGAVDSQVITGSEDVIGTPQYDKVLTAGAVNPADASVSYQWQYSKSPSGSWSDINGERGNTYTVESMYHGYYLRVVTKGVGEYTGEIVSNPVGPVVGDPGTLSNVWYEGGTGGIRQVGGTPFDSSFIRFNTASDATKEGTVSYVVTTVNENATVTIRNKTNGFETVGKSADIPVEEGNNAIEIEVTYDGKTRVWYITHEIVQMMYELYIYVSTDYEGNSLTATWKDEKGQTQSYTVKKGNADECLEIAAGTEVTITSTLHPGKYPFLYDDNANGLIPDLTKPGYPATFVLKESTDIYLFSSEMMAYPPEDLTARWMLMKDNMQVSVKALQKSDSSSVTYEKVDIAVLDSAGKQVETAIIDGTVEPDADGYYRVSFNGLDCSKAYTIKAYYSDLYNSYGSLEKQTATYTLKKRTPITISTKTEHVVLKPGETVNVPILYDGYAGSGVTLENGYDTAVVSEAGTTIKTDISGNRILQITAAKEDGTTYLTLRGDDYEAENGMQYVYTFVRVDVSSVDEAPPIYLGVKKGTLNLYDDSTLTIPVYQMECGHDIEGAQFADASLNEKLAIEVVNDRTLRVVPKVPEDDGTIDFAKWVKESGRTGTFSSKIIVNYNGAASRESEKNLKITLTAVKPKTKVSALTFNSFYTKQTKHLKVTVKGEKVAKVQLDTAKTKGTIVACPDWLVYNEADKCVDFNGNTVPENKTSTYLYLKVWPEGYRMPIQVKVKVNVAYTIPKLKFNRSTVTVIRDISANPSLEIKLISNDKNVKFEDIGVQSFDLMTYLEYMKLSTKNRKKHVNPSIFDDSYVKFNPATGNLALSFANKPTSGKVVLYAHIADGKKPVKVSFNLKVQSAPTLKVNKDSVTVDAIFGSYPYDNEQRVKLSCNVSEYQIDSGNVLFKVTMIGDKKKKDYSSHFDFGWDEDTREICVLGTQNMKPGKTYKVTVSMTGIKKTTSFNIKVIKSATPAFKTTKSEVTLNRIQDGSTAPITISLPKKYGTCWYTAETEVIRPDGIKDNGSLSLEWAGKNEVYFRATDTTVKGTYTVKINGGFYGNGYNPGNKDAAIKHAEIKVKVVDKCKNISAKSSVVTLNKDLESNDKVTVILPKPDKYKYASDTPWSITKVVGADGKDASDKLSYNLTGNTVTIACNDLTKYNTTYKLTFACKFAYDVEKQTTVTVKTAKKNATISIDGNVKGSIDTTRPDTTKAAIAYTYTNWNETNYEGENAPLLEWEVYAKNGKKAVKKSEGALNDNGLVAKGSSLSEAQQAGSWFENIGYTADTPYKLTFMIDTDNVAWEEENISPDYTYTVKATLTFPSTGEVVKAKAVTFDVKQGTVKYAQSPKKVTLTKLDPKGRALFTITDKNKDRNSVASVAKLEVVSDKKVPVSKKIEIVPVYSANGKSTYAVYWKDKTSAGVKSGTVKVNIYLEGNDPVRKKPNASFKLKVNVK